LVANQKPVDYDTIKKELNDLKSKPAGPTLTPEQQQKLNDYDRVVKQKEAALEKTRESMTRKEYEAFVEVNNNIR